MTPFEPPPNPPTTTQAERNLPFVSPESHRRTSSAHKEEFYSNSNTSTFNSQVNSTQTNLYSMNLPIDTEFYSTTPLTRQNIPQTHDHTLIQNTESTSTDGDNVHWNLFALPLVMFSSIPWKLPSISRELNLQVEVGGRTYILEPSVGDYVSRGANLLLNSKVICAIISITLATTMLVLTINRRTIRDRRRLQCQSPVTIDKELSTLSHSSSRTILQHLPQDLTILLNWPYMHLPPPLTRASHPLSANPEASSSSSSTSSPSTIHSQQDLLNHLLLSTSNPIHISSPSLESWLHLQKHISLLPPCEPDLHNRSSSRIRPTFLQSFVETSKTKGRFIEAVKQVDTSVVGFIITPMDFEERDMTESSLKSTDVSEQQGKWEGCVQEVKRVITHPSRKHAGSRTWTGLRRCKNYEAERLVTEIELKDLGVKMSIFPTENLQSLAFRHSFLEGEKL